MNNTSHLVLYRIKSQFIHNQIVFPNVNTLSLVHCHQIGIKRILNSYVFPNLREIQYLSTHPGEYDIYHRIHPNIKWIFPNYSFGFYDSMFEAGRGIKSDLLIPNNIKDMRIINESTYFNLHIPNYYIINGFKYLTIQNIFLADPYGKQLEKYNMSPLNLTSLNQYNVKPDCIFKDYDNKRLNKIFMKTIIDDYNSEKNY
jgi:hypothetical protein